MSRSVSSLPSTTLNLRSKNGMQFVLPSCVKFSFRVKLSWVNPSEIFLASVHHYGSSKKDHIDVS